MLACNFKEAYIYCNKALEINPNSSEIWENKAICTLQLSTFENLEEKAGEIITYLNISKKNNPNSQTYNDTCKSIADNLFQIIRYKYNSIFPDTNKKYSNTKEREIISYIRLFELFFKIYPKSEYLEKAIFLMINCKVHLILIS